MARKKNKNKNKGNNTQTQKVKPQVSKPLSDDEKINIEIQNEETQKKLEELNLKSNTVLSLESKKKLEEAKQKDDLFNYWKYVKNINSRLETLITKTEEEKERTIKLNLELEKTKNEIEGKKKEISNKLEYYNEKDKELTEREFALDNGEYANVIRRLLDTIKDTEKKVFTDTENLIKELRDFHKNNLNEYTKTFKEFSENEIRLNDLKKEQKKLENEKIKFETDKRIFEEDIKEEYEEKFKEDLKDKTAEITRLKRKYQSIEQENQKLKELIENLENEFESTNAQKILMEYSLIKSELNNLKKELNERPEKYELDSKIEQIEELKSIIEQLKEENNENELLELRKMFYNKDSLQLKLNQMDSLLESAHTRETSLLKTIKDLESTIDQLKGEKEKSAKAFEFAQIYDSDPNLKFRLQANPPENLNELVRYVQERMAFNDEKPFYYSEETIRIFLSGLHMSPITILQGISGTGKTSLPREFAKAIVSDSNYLGKDDNNQNKSIYRICAVQAGWRDNMDLMGYYNSFEHKYKETDFFKALYMANQPKYKDALFLIILDEMNLSRPEHYFADFLSLLEQSPNERFIDLTNTPKEVWPNLIKGGKLKVPENVRFIGTANHDETTLEFAPKTYDRSNVMEMPKNYPEKIKDKIRRPNEKYNITYRWLENEFKEAENKHKNSYEKFHNFINSKDFKSLLGDKDIGIGNRLEDQAKRFISVFVESGTHIVKDLAIAADHLITSRLFRQLKNKYDLDKSKLASFKDDYEIIFDNEFKREPKFAIELLERELS